MTYNTRKSHKKRKKASVDSQKKNEIIVKTRKFPVLYMVYVQLVYTIQVNSSFSVR